jgi:biotin synthase
MDATEILQALKRRAWDEGSLVAALAFKQAAQGELFRLAREQRSLYFPGGEVEVRGVLEISNSCRRRCNFCGMNRHSPISRYLIGHDEALGIAGQVYAKGARNLLIQSGEDDSPRFTNHVCRCIASIKSRFADMSVILCLGGLPRSRYQQLKEAGARRYILKFETSNPALYEKLKPGDRLEDRVARIHDLIDLGFEVGSGNIVGLPGQTAPDLARDLLFLSRFKLGMGSATVFIPGRDCRYRDRPPGDVDMTLNYMALMRIMYPRLLIPTTSSLEHLRKEGQYLGLLAGANTVTMHDAGPGRMKKMFPIYAADRFLPDEAHLRAIVRRAGLGFPSRRGQRL